jgi:hypothetical protein
MRKIAFRQTMSSQLACHDASNRQTELGGQKLEGTGSQILRRSFFGGKLSVPRLAFSNALPNP